METREVISGLVGDLRPVSPLLVPPVRLVWWVVGSAVCVAAVVAGLGLRNDLASTAFSLTFQAHSLLLTAAALGSAAAALTLAVPGERLPAWLQSTPMLAALAWGGWLAVELMTYSASAGGPLWPISAGWGCVAKAFAVGVMPGFMLAVMVGRGAPTHVRGAASFAAMAGAAVGALGVEITCPVDNPMHLLLWHAATALVFVLAASMVCWAVLAMIDRRGLRR